jgi:formylglycine-generating enzyme
VKRVIHLTIVVTGFLIAYQSGAQEPTHTNSIGMEFVLIQPGSMVIGKFQPPYPVPEDTVKNASHERIMWMGDGRSYNTQEFNHAKDLAASDAMPGFEVKIPKPYYIGKFEVTQAQWKKVMGANPSVFQGEKVNSPDDHPVESVTWEDVKRFLKKLNAMEKGRRYRLPTEFEWEYAARAGRQDDIPWPDIQASAQLGGVTTSAVAQKQPNAWGLYDMLGNVWEWVEDIYNKKIFADPNPPRKGKQHVLKGASFTGDVKNATYMTHAGGPGNGWDVGFRVVMEID